jgi:hypothetical protein
MKIIFSVRSGCFLLREQHRVSLVEAIYYREMASGQHSTTLTLNPALTRTQTDTEWKFIMMCVVFLMYRKRESGEPKKKSSAGCCCFSFASHLSIAENAPHTQPRSTRPVVPSGPLRAGCVCLARFLHTTTGRAGVEAAVGVGSGGHEEEGKNYIREEGERSGQKKRQLDGDEKSFFLFLYSLAGGFSSENVFFASLGLCDAMRCVLGAFRPAKSARNRQPLDVKGRGF